MTRRALQSCTSAACYQQGIARELVPISGMQNPRRHSTYCSSVLVMAKNTMGDNQTRVRSQMSKATLMAPCLFRQHYVLCALTFKDEWDSIR
jgi:hypothetical protein